MRKLFHIAIVAMSLVSGCKGPKQAAFTAASVYAVDTIAVRKAGVVQLLKSYKHGVDSQMGRVIGYSAATLSKQQPESDLGDFFADAQLVAAQKLDTTVVASVMNYGGIRVPFLQKGAVTNGQIFELLPFDNMLVTAYIPADTLKLLCDHVAKLKGWPVSGIRFEIHADTARNIWINGRPLVTGKVYKVSMNDYIANGGDNCSFLKPLRKDTYPVLLRDVVITHVKELHARGDSIHSKTDNRIVYAR